MRPTVFLLTLFFSMLVWNSSFAQMDNVPSSFANDDETVSTTKHLNFFIISKRKKGKLDLATRFDVLRSKIKSFFCGKKFVAIVVNDTKQMSEKVQYRLKKFNAYIGTIWFDSHGKFSRGYSNFFIGQNEYNYKNVKDADTIQYLKQLAPLSDQQTKIVIGSCYGGATYYRSSFDYKDITRMNGDSLMLELGNIFSQATVYASESWVMTKPGLFWKASAVTGTPIRKRFKDICYKPVWGNVGKWNEYNALTGQFQHVNPITLDKHGNMFIRKHSYTEKKKMKEKILKSLQKLQPGLYK